jgi:hypothetical protein
MGTTWLFNVLREMCSLGRIDLGVVADGVPSLHPSRVGPVIIKSHRADPPVLVEEFDDLLNLVALVMLRDATRTFASLLRTQTASRSDVIGWLEQDMTSYEAVLPAMRHVAVIREEWISDQGPAIVRQLANLTTLTLTDEQCDEVAKRFDREQVRKTIAQLEETRDWSHEFTNYDRDSQWHAGHIGPAHHEQIVVSFEEASRLEALQGRIVHLTEAYSMWQTAEVGQPRDSRTSTGDYIRARQLNASDIAAKGRLSRWFTRLLHPLTNLPKFR